MMWSVVSCSSEWFVDWCLCVVEFCKKIAEEPSASNNDAAVEASDDVKEDESVFIASKWKMATMASIIMNIRVSLSRHYW